MNRLRRAFLLAGLLGGLAPSAASAGDAVAFVSHATPTALWRRGYGAAASSDILGIVELQGELARQPGEALETWTTTFTASALVAPPLPFVTPYGGLGVGLYRQQVSGVAENGTLRALILGVKVKLGIAVAKAEYRRISLAAEAILPLENRVSLGVGLSF